MLTPSQFAFQREVNLPIELAINSELRGRLIEAMKQSPDKAREGEVALFGIENNLKRTIGRTRALGDPAFSAMLAKNEAELRARAPAMPRSAIRGGEIDGAVAAQRAIDAQRRFSRPSGDLMTYALRLVRAAEERAKPDGERLSGYSDSALPLLEKQVLDAKPVFGWLEQLRIEWSLLKAREYLGTDHAQTRLLLGKESPDGLAARLVTGTRLGDAAGAQGAVGRRRGGDRRLDRSDDRLRPPHRRQRAPPPENL